MIWIERKGRQVYSIERKRQKINTEEKGKTGKGKGEGEEDQDRA